MSRLAICSAAALALTLAAQDASAGNLGKTTKSIAKKQKSSNSGGSSGASTPRRPRERDRRHVVDGDRYYYSGAAYYHRGYRAPCEDCSAAVGKTQRIPTRVDFRATYENVRGSDGSLNLDARVSAGPFGFGFGVSSYFEAAGSGADTVRMTMWEGNAGARALQIADSTELWLTLGVAGLRSNQFDNVLGGAVGAALRHQVTGGLSLDGQARTLLFEDDVKASELRAGITASVLHLGYRYLRFNVGPALQGPEVGLSLRF